MKKLFIYIPIIGVFTSCIQNYPTSYIKEVENLCTCMEMKKKMYKRDLSKEIVFLYEDEDYQACILDALINQIDVEGKEFRYAIKDHCPEIMETHDRYVKDKKLYQ